MGAKKLPSSFDAQGHLKVAHLGQEVCWWGVLLQCRTVVKQQVDRNLCRSCGGAVLGRSASRGVIAPSAKRRSTGMSGCKYRPVRRKPAMAFSGLSASDHGVLMSLGNSVLLTTKDDGFWLRAIWSALPTKGCQLRKQATSRDCSRLLACGTRQRQRHGCFGQLQRLVHKVGAVLVGQ